MAKNLRMRAARAGLDLSQQGLADAVGVTRQTINAVEQGDYNPTIKLCVAICRVLGTTLDGLFWDADLGGPPAVGAGSVRSGVGDDAERNGDDEI
jgi:putative transcriptional regulator